MWKEGWFIIVGKNFNKKRRNCDTCWILQNKWKRGNPSCLSYPSIHSGATFFFTYNPTIVDDHMACKCNVNFSLFSPFLKPFHKAHCCLLFLSFLPYKSLKIKIEKARLHHDAVAALVVVATPKKWKKKEKSAKFYCMHQSNAA